MKLKYEVLEKIKTDIKLFSIVCDELGIKPSSMPETIKRNGNNLNQYGIVVKIAEYLGEPLENIMEETELSI